MNEKREKICEKKRNNIPTVSKINEHASGPGIIVSTKCNQYEMAEESGDTDIDPRYSDKNHEISIICHDGPDDFNDSYISGNEQQSNVSKTHFKYQRNIPKLIFRRRDPKTNGETSTPVKDNGSAKGAPTMTASSTIESNTSSNKNSLETRLKTETASPQLFNRDSKGHSNNTNSEEKNRSKLENNKMGIISETEKSKDVKEVKEMDKFTATDSKTSKIVKPKGRTTTKETRKREDVSKIVDITKR